MSNDAGKAAVGAMPSGQVAAQEYVCSSALFSHSAHFYLPSLCSAPSRIVQPADVAKLSQHPDKEEVMAILLRFANESLAENGYYPNLLQEYEELRQSSASLRASNTKLYSDNRSLAILVQQQEERR